ncbi:hypothetical protein LTR02_017130 [Friedmanniomyces endolithicus]|nr:hypothetical protein LTR87_017036 [Friedmanniomyces endolithicus]KAK0887544.1 hypothetical protein LTR02_017130 [Friedmanniomyces endolithicus]
MPPTTLQHRRTHNLLLINKLLSQRDASSPFTLVLDSLEQSARPLISEYMRRAKLANVHVVFVSFETLRKPRDADVFISAWNLTLPAWQKEVADALKEQQGQIYHQDIPLPTPLSNQNTYSPPPLTLLKYLATTIFTMHSLHHVLARKAARERSVVEPSFGLEEGKEGVLLGLGANGREGVVLEMEHRRKSGRGVREWYFLSRPAPRRSQAGGVVAGRGKIGDGRGEVGLLEDHPEYRSPEREGVAGGEGEEGGTFELGLTEKQRRDREGVVLPYFDAQKGGGEGGRILYDMGSEDDFDEEEDEI